MNELDKLQSNIKLFEYWSNEFLKENKFRLGDELAIQHINAKLKDLTSSLMERMNGTN